MEKYFYSYLQITYLVYLSLAVFLAFSFPKRKGFWFRLGGSFLVGYFSMIVVSMVSIPGNSLITLTLKYILLTVVGVIALFFVYDIDISTAIFLGVIAYTIRHLNYLIANMFNNIFSDTIEGYEASKYIVRYLYVFIVYLFSSPILLKLSFDLKKYYKNVKFSIRTVVFLAFLCVVVTIVVNYFSMSYFRKMDYSIKYTMEIFNILICILIVSFCLSLVKKEHYETQSAVLKQIEYESAQQYIKSRENVELINVKCHDLRHQIRQFKADLSSVNQESLNELENQLRIYDTRVKSGNDILDLILSEKSLICQKENISFDRIVDGKLLSFISEDDLYLLFTNVIDNAIDASRLVPNVNKRIITLKIIAVSGFVQIYQENTYVGERQFKDGLPLTSQNQDHHGYGMKSIKNIVNRYGGILKIETENDLFKLQIFFNQKS